MEFGTGGEAAWKKKSFEISEWEGGAKLKNVVKVN